MSRPVITDLPAEVMARISSSLSRGEQNKLATSSTALRPLVRGGQQQYIDTIYDNRRYHPVYFNSLHTESNRDITLQSFPERLLSRDITDKLFRQWNIVTHTDVVRVFLYEGDTITIRKESPVSLTGMAATFVASHQPREELVPVGPFAFYLVTGDRSLHNIKLIKITGNFERIEGKLYPELNGLHTIEVKPFNLHNPGWSNLRRAIEDMAYSYPRVVTEPQDEIQNSFAPIVDIFNLPNTRLHPYYLMVENLISGVQSGNQYNFGFDDRQLIGNITKYYSNPQYSSGGVQFGYEVYVVLPSDYLINKHYTFSLHDIINHADEVEISYHNQTGVHLLTRLDESDMDIDTEDNPVIFGTMFPGTYVHRM